MRTQKQQISDAIQLLISTHAVLTRMYATEMPRLNPLTGSLVPPDPIETHQDIEQDHLWQTAVRIALDQGVTWDWVKRNF